MDQDGRLSDWAVTKDKILSFIDEFEIKKDSKLKDGYTEKRVQNQLLGFLRDKIENVSEEYGIEGINATRIDLDIGKGKVGLEIKLAKSVFKTAGQDRMVGQLDTFIKNKYYDDNLLLMIVCEPHHLNDRAMQAKIEERLEDKLVDIVFFPLEKPA